MAKLTLRRLSDPVSSLNGVGNALAEKLVKLGIVRVQDLLFHLPYRYIDRTRITPIDALLAGHDAYIEGQIDLAQIRYGRRRSLLCQISDGTGSLVLRFFYFSKKQQQAMQQGKRIRCYGQVRRGPSLLEIVHPEYRLFYQDGEIELDEQLTPVYPATEGLQQTQLRKLTEQALQTLKMDNKGLSELLPDDILQQQDLPTLVDALDYVHRPPPDADINALMENRHPAQQRLAYEEILAQQLSLQELRKSLRTEPAPRFKPSQLLVAAFIKQLPFTLTHAQQRAFKIISSDMDKVVAMLRLVQGDVGSGKTVVAALASLQAIEAGYQVAIMSPTELLAEQHATNFSGWFSALGIDVCFLSGKLRKAGRETLLKRLAEDKPLVAIGTHALFQESVAFARLGLVIIDEQHRFGVHQRLKLLEKGRQQQEYPHQLIMTATPIPRTLTMTVYADLDHIVIDELPPNRPAIMTSVISNQRRDDIIQRIDNLCREGRQVYWVCTLIEESEKLQCETATDTHELLSESLNGVETGLIHGRMKHDEKESIMRRFKQEEIQLLVATTVIEVGVDVPNASLMIIENAERLGLSQLHQLRGRVGRGAIQSNCILMYQPPLGDLAKQRLEALRQSNDGFFIAEKDLALRGPGEILGTRQTGMPELRVANFVRDAHLLPIIQKTAKIMLNQYPEQVELLISRWLGNNIDYSNV